MQLTSEHDCQFLLVPDLKKIIKLRKIFLGKYPTPLSFEKNNNVSIKRDDLSGYGRSGIKTRKLEACLSYLLEKKYTDLLLTVPNISNLRNDLELFASKQFIKIHFIISNEPKLQHEKRKKIFEPLNNKNVTYNIAKTKIGVVLLFIKKYILLFFSNKKVAVVLPSFAHPSSIMGSANGMLELLNQYSQLKRPFPQDLFISACTGSSAAGLVLASLVFKEQKLANTKIHIAQTFPGNLKSWIRLLLWWTKIKYRLNVKIRLSNVKIYYKKEGPSYGCSNNELLELCKEAKDNFKIDIDPIYGARAFSIMKDFLKENSGGKSEILYWHCGFTPDWNLANS